MRVQRLAEKGWKTLNRIEQRLRIARITENNANVILKYHSIGSHSYGNQDLSRFASNIEYLTTHYQINNLFEVVMDANSNQKQIALTFDDGYRDFYENVYPILKEHEVPATVFIIGATLTDDHQFSDRNKFKNKKFITQPQVREFVESDLIRIGAHTMSHPFLSELNREKQHQEIREAKRYLESKFDTEIEAFCYPYGDYSDETVELAERYFKIAVTSDHGFIKCNEKLAQMPRISGNQENIAINMTDIGNKVKQFGSFILG